MAKQKFLVFTYFDDNCHHGCSFRDIAKITTQSFKDYCDINSYDFIIKDSNFTPGRTIGWTKFEIFLENLNKYDWIFYLEADSMIMNETIRLENLVDNNYNIIISQTSDGGLSCGPMFIKSSDWSKEFCKKMLSKTEYYSNPMVEQSAINDEIRNNEETKKHCRINNLRMFNSFYHQFHPENQYKPGDFIIHGAGQSNSYRAALFTFLKDKIIKIPNYKIPYKPFLNIGDENL